MKTLWNLGFMAFFTFCRKGAKTRSFLSLFQILLIEADLSSFYVISTKERSPRETLQD
jgi:hypothetical protein